MKTIGLIINPIAGMGGRVGLKGTDGRDILRKAINLGAQQEAPKKALLALKELEGIRDKLLFLTVSSDMGEEQCKELDLNYEVIYKPSGETNSDDTINATRIMKKRDVELILFTGGDGTARDIYEAIGTDIPVIGIPGGVKIHSPVYGNTPISAGKLAHSYLENNLPLKEEEVIDLDEDAYRSNIMRTSLYGYLKIPFQKEFLQNKKAPTPLTEEATQRAIALDISDYMEEDTYYIIGPGTTTRAIMDELNLPNSLLGVDIIKNKEMIKLDCNENELLDIVEDGNVKLIITPTGGQGYLLGRGNQQISPEVLKKIKKDNIMIISTNDKILSLSGKPLLIYTGDENLDKMLTGYYRVKIGYGTDLMYPISN